MSAHRSRSVAQIVILPATEPGPGESGGVFTFRNGIGEGGLDRVAQPRHEACGARLGPDGCEFEQGADTDAVLQHEGATLGEALRPGQQVGDARRPAGDALDLDVLDRGVGDRPGCGGCVDSSVAAPSQLRALSREPQASPERAQGTSGSLPGSAKKPAWAVRGSASGWSVQAWIPLQATERTEPRINPYGTS